MKRILILTALALLALPTIACGSTHAVVMGCAKLGSAGATLPIMKAHPQDCGISALEGTSAGLKGAHWSKWGAPRAIGTGHVVDGLGFLHPAHFVAFGRIRRNAVTFYSRLHVLSMAVTIHDTNPCQGCAAYTREPGLNKTVNITPSQLREGDK
jgi:hypothetical protein